MAEAFPVLDLSKILKPRKEKEVAEGEMAKQEATGTDEAAVEVLKLEVIMAVGLKEASATPKA